MIDLKNAAAALILGFAAAGAMASPALAQTPQAQTSQERAARTHPGHQPGHAARAQASRDEIGIYDMTRHRANAMRECNERADRYPQHTHGNMQSFAYWNCMMERGEPD